MSDDPWENEAVELLGAALAADDGLTWQRANRGSRAPLYRTKARRLIESLRKDGLDVRPGPDGEDGWRD